VSLNNNKSNKKYVDLKVMIVGDSKVGKTTLLLKFFQGEFILNLDITYTGVNLFRKSISTNESNELINYYINLWDIAGSDGYIDFFQLISYPLNALIILVSSENEDNIDNSVKKWISIIESFINTEVLKFLIITQRADGEIDQTKIKGLIKRYNIEKYFLIDVKNTSDVNSVFEEIFSKIMKKDV
jgi:small GTP-binding protein